MNQVGMKAPYFLKNPLQTTTCVTSDANESTDYVLCISRRDEWISTVEQCGLQGIPCHTSGSLQEGHTVQSINRVKANTTKLSSI